MVKRTLVNLWRDDFGGVVSSEYVMVGSIVVVGSSAGLVSLRDAGTKQMQQLAELPAATLPDADMLRQQTKPTHCIAAPNATQQTTAMIVQNFYLSPPAP